MKFYNIPTSDGALGKNFGCEKSPEFISKLFKVNSETFELTKGDVEEQQKQIFDQAQNCFNEKPFFIGGTHDITFSLFKAFVKKHKNASILIFDAHADCDEGTSVPSHEDFVRELIKQKIVAPEQVMIVGLRKVYDSEKEFLQTSGIRFIIDQVVKDSFDDAKLMVEKFVTLAENLYISFDVDVLSSRIMKATHYFPDGGLTEKEAKELLNLTFARAKAFDLVEFNPEKISKNEDELLKNLFKDYF